MVDPGEESSRAGGGEESEARMEYYDSKVKFTVSIQILACKTRGLSTIRSGMPARSREG